MTELSSELKKAEKCVFEIHTRYYGEVGKDERIDAIRVKRVAKALEDKWLPSQVVASFLEVARKEFLGCVDEIGVKAKGFNQVQVLAVVSALKKKHEQVYGREGK